MKHYTLFKVLRWEFASVCTRIQQKPIRACQKWKTDCFLHNLHLNLTSVKVWSKSIYQCRRSCIHTISVRTCIYRRMCANLYMPPHVFILLSFDCDRCNSSSNLITLDLVPGTGKYTEQLGEMFLAQAKKQGPRQEFKHCPDHCPLLYQRKLTKL